MKKCSSLAIGLLCASAAFTAACSSDTPATTGTGGTSGGSGGKGGGVALTGVALTPDMTGWVDKASNPLMVQGPWYSYSDATGVASCTTLGMHKPEECSKIIAPDATATGFPNTGGKMCTEGTVEMVINLGTAPDYSNMWGAGIALDLANSGGSLGIKGEFDAVAAGVKGVSFDIDTVPAPKLRVEFPSMETDKLTAGGDYWGATSSYPPSPVVAGTNVIMWSDVKGPMGHVFNPAKILSIQFHVPTSTSAGGSFKYCISNLKMLM